MLPSTELYTVLTRNYAATESWYATTPFLLWRRSSHNYIDLILKKHEEQLAAQAKGIDYTKLITYKGWPFAAFVQKLAELLGRKGGTSTFSTDELETLKKLHDKHSDITEPTLVKAFEEAEIKNIAHVAHQLQNLKKE